LDVRIADDERRIAELAGESNRFVLLRSAAKPPTHTSLTAVKHRSLAHRRMHAQTCAITFDQSHRLYDLDQLITT